MSALGDLFGAGSVAEQLLVWGLMNQAIGAAAAPYFSQLQQDVSARSPVEPLSPADAASAVVRNFLTAAEGSGIAARSGIPAGTFGTMIALSADAPGPQQLAAGLLRGLIAESGTGEVSTSFEQGIAEGRLGDKWAPLIKGLAEALLSPADAASAVVRNFLTMADGESVAAKSGVDPGTFATLVALSGDAPGPQQLAEALRRGAIQQQGTGIDSTSFQQGIAEGRLSDKWAPVIQALSTLWPTPVDALDAALKGQVSAAEGESLYVKLGGDPQFYQWLLDSQGSGPSPLEAADWARRGIIPWDGTGPGVTSYAQAVKESRFRDKWADAYKAQAEYILPPLSVITLLKDGAITKEQATSLLQQRGATPEIIAALIAEADATSLSQYRGLSESAALQMYYNRLISESDVTSILESLHVSKQAIPLVLAYVDLQKAIAQQNSAVSRIGTLYATRKITEQTAKASLIQLQVPGAAVNDIVKTWQLENSINVKTLTESQIVDAWEYQVLTQQEAETELANIGYTPFDAWVLLSNKAKAALPGRPAPGPAPPQGTVIPGVT